MVEGKPISDSRKGCPYKVYVNKFMQNSGAEIICSYTIVLICNIATAVNLISPIPPQKTKNSSRFAFETAAVIILLYRISDVILDYVIKTGVNIVVFASDGCAPFARYCVEVVVLYVCAFKARLAADDVPVGFVRAFTAALI